MHCLICNRPTSGASYCQEHQRELDKAREAHKHKKPKAEKYVFYRGHLVGFFKHNGHLKPSYIGMSKSGIPKAQLINLDEYCEGFTRTQIKKLKAAVLRLS